MTQIKKRAVVFAYHNVGVRCINTLLDFGVEIALIVTHEDNPNEQIWFDSVAQLAIAHHIPFITPIDPNEEAIVDQIASMDVDLLFSFYYRNMLKKPLLSIPKIGAFNMHGSFLPYYRGRVPINWAIIHGETETGATLHQMNEKPDNGPIVDQMRVPILINDTAQDLFLKVTVAAEMVLHRSLPSLTNGSLKLTPQDLSAGSYFGGRTAKDGAISEQATAKAVHNLVRALSHPYPGAFIPLTIEGRSTALFIWKTRLLTNSLIEKRAIDNPSLNLSMGGYQIVYDGHLLQFVAYDGSRLEILEMSFEGKTFNKQTNMEQISQLFNQLTP